MFGDSPTGQPGWESSSRGSCPVLAGTTAAGKTAIVVALARHEPVEVISLDSRQIYQGMRIGTAQPTVSEQAVCQHHLVDFVNPRDSYSAAQYRQDFMQKYREIVARGKVPMLVGGAGLYLNSLQEGFFELPGVTTSDTYRVREELQELSDTDIRSRLQARDQASWEQIHPNDRYRNQRALEICILARCPLSELKRGQKSRPALDLEFPVVLVQRSTAETAARVARRTRAMLSSGWLAETESLISEHGPDAVGLRTIGYREICAHLQGQIGPEEMEERIIVSTRQYAKRQRTWFRQVPTVTRGRPDDPAVLKALYDLVTRTRKAITGEQSPPA